MFQKVYRDEKHKLSKQDFYSQIVKLLQAAKSKEVGKMIVKEEQDGKERADYGKEILINLSDIFSKEFGKCFSVDNLENMRRFFLAYENSETLSRKSENAFLTE